MKKKFIVYFLAVVLIISSFFIIKNFKNNNVEIESIKLSGTVVSIDDNKLVIKDNQDVIYTFNFSSNDIEVGANIVVEYKANNIISYSVTTKNSDIPSEWLDNGIFSDYYELAYSKLKNLTLDEKIGQLFLVRYNEESKLENLDKYKFSGYIFYKKDFNNKTKSDVINMINTLQKNSNIPLLTAVDEEGGKVVRISSNPNLASEAFKSPSELYNIGSFGLIKQDTIDKSKLLYSLGINLNLAPVVDVSTDPNDYIYDRTLTQSTDLTSTYAKTVIEASKGTNVSYTLKHFPGYGNNINTHEEIAIDNRSYDSIMSNDIPPFKVGIEAGAEAVLLNHNIVTSIDSSDPASISKKVNNLLKNSLHFTGVSITDDLDMTALKSINNVAVKAILAGNELLIVSDYSKIDDVKTAVNNGTIDENIIDKAAFKVLAWKYYKGLMLQDSK